MKSYEKLLKLAIDGELPKNISEDDFPDIDIFVELYNRGFIDAIDASTLDGKAYLNPKITFEKMPGTKSVDLKITDKDGLFCQKSLSVSIITNLPKYK